MKSSVHNTSFPPGSHDAPDVMRKPGAGKQAYSRVEMHRVRFFLSFHFLLFVDDAPSVKEKPAPQGQAYWQWWNPLEDRTVAAVVFLFVARAGYAEAALRPVIHLP